MTEQPLKIAVIGSGVAGLSATWLLNEHSPHEVHLFDKSDYAGGHAHSFTYQPPGLDACVVDTAFIAYNRKTYPNFCRFLDHQRISSIPFDLSLGVEHVDDGHEWASADLWSLLCGGRNAFKPRTYRMLIDIFRFNILARHWLRASSDASTTVGEWLSARDFSPAFETDYLLPLTSGIWAVPADSLLSECPMAILLNGMQQHQMLRIWDKEQPLAIAGGAARYVESIICKIPREQLHLGTSIERVELSAGGTDIHIFTPDQRQRFDRVIMAVHSEECVRLLGNILDSQKACLQSLASLKWQSNTVYLHSDESFLPRSPSTVSAYNCLVRGDRHKFHQTFTLNLNRAVHLPRERHGPVLLSLSPLQLPDPQKTAAVWTYAHPQFSVKALQDRQRAKSLFVHDHIAIAGAWMGRGFHEEGWVSGLEAVQKLGIEGIQDPWADRDRPLVLPVQLEAPCGWLERCWEDIQLILLAALSAILAACFP